MIRVTRRYRFCASHRLHVPSLSAEENRKLFGKCNNPFGHGHNYELEISFNGPVQPRSGRVADTRRLDSLVQAEILDRLDQTDLNSECEPFREVIPTSENLGFELCRRLKRAWHGVFPGEWPRLERIRIAETPRNIFEVFADEIK